jgi:tRNA(Ile)-lysidine synthase TilS/MesJ
MAKSDIPLHERLAYYLLKGLNRAVRDYAMIGAGDRVAVAVSGGKDSLTLLHLLRLRQRSAQDKYDVVAVHVTGAESSETPCSTVKARRTLEAYFRAQAQEYAIEAMEAAPEPDCARCAYLRRRALFEAAKRMACNRIALGHHADDAAQTTLLNLIFSGRAETLRPSREFFAGRFVLIRPMMYVEEKEIARFAEAAGLPAVQSRCPSERTSHRIWVKGLIRIMEQEQPKVKINLIRAGLKFLEQERRAR